MTKEPDFLTREQIRLWFEQDAEKAQRAAEKQALVAAKRRAQYELLLKEAEKEKNGG
jgi:hypothetical protein